MSLTQAKLYLMEDRNNYILHSSPHNYITYNLYIPALIHCNNYKIQIMALINIIYYFSNSKIYIAK